MLHRFRSVFLFVASVVMQMFLADTIWILFFFLYGKKIKEFYLTNILLM